MKEKISNKAIKGGSSENKNSLFEKTYIPPAYGKKMVSRVCTDGGYYLLDEENEWKHISDLTAEGLIELKNILLDCFSLDENIIQNRNQSGTVIWKIFLKDAFKEIVVAGIPHGKLKIFEGIENVLNTKMKKIPSD